MSLEERREAIVRATLPLLAQHGANITTSQVAQAAGIAEGTVFRAFKDKNELLMTCIGAAMKADEEIDSVRAIPGDLPVEERLSRVATAAEGYLRRLFGLMQTLRGSGFHPKPEDHEEQDPRKGPQAEMRRLGDAVADLLEPEADQLRLTPNTTAGMFLGLVFLNQMQQQVLDEAPPAAITEVIDVFLHGALTTSTMQTGGTEE